MSQTPSLQQDIESFHEFASAAIARGSENLTIDDLFEQWRIERLNEEDLKAIKVSPEDVAAVEEALCAMDRGDTGEDADEVIRSLLSELSQRS